MLGSTKPVTAVLGSTNTGKTHLAIERMLGYKNGIIGLPLRLLAREVYDKVVARVGVDNVALITGEEKIKPSQSSYYVCTVEAMPQDIEVEFLAIDEMQLATDFERGHIFTDKILHNRGTNETMLLGSATMREVIGELLPDTNFIIRPRLSKLTYSGSKKITRLPERSAVVAFNSDKIYAIAELIRRQKGGAAVVMGALSPRTRNAQIELYQSGEVDIIVATDAIGMGLNMDIDHVAFAGASKFDGKEFRDLTAAELAQIAGRAGRHMNDGSFGVTGDIAALEQEIIERIEKHEFPLVKNLQWRNRNLDFSSLGNLLASLEINSQVNVLTRAINGTDIIALNTVANNNIISDLATDNKSIELLWDVCQIPDYRNVANSEHVGLISEIYQFLMSDAGIVPDEWLNKQLQYADRTEGDIDAISNRISYVRTCSFIANRSEWLKDYSYWQRRTREVEDKLSDVLHEALLQRFVDRRTSVLMKGLKQKEDLDSVVANDEKIIIEGEFVGYLRGFNFVPDLNSNDLKGKTLRSAALGVVAKELRNRANEFVHADAKEIELTDNCEILWQNNKVGFLRAGNDILSPQVVVNVSTQLEGKELEAIKKKLQRWLDDYIIDTLKPLILLRNNNDIKGLASGIAYRLIENLGLISRDKIADDIRELSQGLRSGLRKFGVKFGEFSIFIPILLKPKAARLRLILWNIYQDKFSAQDISSTINLIKGGATSILLEKDDNRTLVKISGYRIVGKRAIRIDILERLSKLIRELLFWKPKEDKIISSDQKQQDQDKKLPTAIEEKQEETKEQLQGIDNSLNNDEKPEGAVAWGKFAITPAMLSLTGCSTTEFEMVLKSLGFISETLVEQKDSNEKNTNSNEGFSSAKNDKLHDTEGKIWRPRTKVLFNKSAAVTKKHKKRAKVGNSFNRDKKVTQDSPFSVLAKLKNSK